MSNCVFLMVKWYKDSRIHPLGTMNICTKLKFYLSRLFAENWMSIHCWAMAISWHAKNVGRSPKPWSLHYSAMVYRCWAQTVWAPSAILTNSTASILPCISIAKVCWGQGLVLASQVKIHNSIIHNSPSWTSLCVVNLLIWWSQPIPLAI